MDGEDGDEELLTGAGSWTRPQKRQRAELQAAGSTHPGPLRTHLVHVMRRLLK